MRIIHTCLRYPPASGGVETYVEQIVERTRDIHAKRDVRVLTSSMRTHGPITNLDPDALLDDPMYVQRLHHTATPLISYPRLQALPYYIGHHRPNILHSYSFWYQPADVTARYAKKYRIPFIFHPIYYDNEIRHKPIWQIYKQTIGKATFAAADVVVVISPQEKELIEKAGFPVKRFELISPGIDIDRFTGSTLNPFLKRGIKGKVLLSVARLASGKRLSDMIEALPHIIAQNPDTQLAFAGEDFGMQASLQAQAKEVGLENHIHFLGKISDEELASAYQHADLLLHTSEYEAFGITLAESLAAGTPVVARRTGAVPYVVPEGSAGLLFTTPAEIIEHVNAMLSDTNLRQRLGREGQEYVRAHFTWDRSIKKLTKLYEEFSQ